MPPWGHRSVHPSTLSETSLRGTMPAAITVRVLCWGKQCSQLHPPSLSHWWTDSALLSASGFISWGMVSCLFRLRVPRLCLLRWSLNYNWKKWISVLQSRKLRARIQLVHYITPSKQGSHVPTSYAHQKLLKCFFKELLLWLPVYFYRWSSQGRKQWGHLAEQLSTSKAVP